MEGLGALFLRVLEVSAGCSAVVGPLLLLAPRLRKRVAARTFYILFLLLALRLTLPFEVKLPAPVVRVQVPAAVTVSAPRPAAPAQSAQRPEVQSPAPAVQSPAAEGAQTAYTPAVPSQAAQPAPAGRSIPLLQIAAAVWAAGAAACVLWAAGSFLLARRRLLRGARRAGEEERAALERLRQELEVGRPVRLYRSGDTASPLAMGLFRPAVVLPAEGCAGAELPLVLRHELTHIRRWDVAYKLVLSLACAVNWFNPLVWLMDRAAGRNLELCCDDDVARSLSEAGRKEYGRVLLSAAGAGRPLPFTTCFSGGKEQMTNRLLNLFTRKKNSAVLVCLVLAAALLAGGLVACESAGAGGTPGLTAENRARRALLKEYFDANYTADATSVVLADLTGDGLDELLVLIMAPETEEQPPSLREEITEDCFAYGRIECLGAGDGGVFQYPDTLAVTNANEGWGFVYLVPRTDGDGFALLHFRPYCGQGAGSYSYSLYALDEEKGFAELEGDEVGFLLDQSIPWGITSWAVGTEQVQALLDRMRGLRDSGVPLLVYYEDYQYMDGNREFSYCSVPPEEAFGSDTPTDIAALRAHVVTNHGAALFPLPKGEPATPGEALDRLELTLTAYPDMVIFRLPNYSGTWEIQIFGVMRVGDEERGELAPVRYLEDEEWIAGRQYYVDTEGVWFSELTLWARATAPDGTSAERTIPLAENGPISWKRPADIPAPPEDVAAAYLENIARKLFLYEGGSGLEYTAYWGGITAVVSYIPSRNFELLDGRVYSLDEVQSRLRYMDDAVNCLKYRWMAEDIWREDVSIGYTVERVDVDGDYAAVDIRESVGFRYRGLTAPSGMEDKYRVDLVRCDGTWFVVDVNQTGKDPLWCDSKDEESFLALTGLPHDLNWFGNAVNDDRTRPEWAQFLTGEELNNLPVYCVAGWPDPQAESGETRIKLLYSPVAEDDYQVTVRLESDDSLTLLDAGKFPLGAG